MPALIDQTTLFLQMSPASPLYCGARQISKPLYQQQSGKRRHSPARVGREDSAATAAPYTAPWHAPRVEARACKPCLGCAASKNTENRTPQKQYGNTSARTYTYENRKIPNITHFYVRTPKSQIPGITIPNTSTNTSSYEYCYSTYCCFLSYNSPYY